MKETSSPEPIREVPTDERQTGPAGGLRERLGRLRVERGEEIDTKGPAGPQEWSEGESVAVRGPSDGVPERPSSTSPIEPPGEGRVDGSVKVVEAQSRLIETALTPEEHEAVRDYTDEGFRPINRSLRDEQFSTPELQARAERLSQALTKFPAHEGPVYRGADLDPSVLAKYRPGLIVREDAFTSTSTTRPFEGNTQYSIMSKTGRDIHDSSAYSPENEVLFDKGTRFAVLAHDVSGGVHHILLREVP